MISQRSTRSWLRSPATWLIAFVVVVFSGLLASSHQLTWLENLTYDWRFRVRGPRPTPVPITIIEIDQNSLGPPEIAQPLVLWGEKHARVFQILREEGARAIGFDIIQPLSLPHNINPNPDQIEAKAISETPQMVLASIRNLQSGKVTQTLPNERFQYAKEIGGGRLGFANTTPDADGVVRSFALTDVNGADVDGSQSFALALASVAIGQKPRVEERFVTLGSRRIELDENRRCIIDYAGPDSTFSRISYHDLLARPGAFRAQIKDHICLIGTTSYELQDYHAVPFPASGGHLGNLMAGVEVNANMVRTLLSGGVRRDGATVTWLCIGLAVVFSTFCCAFSRIYLVVPALLSLVLGWLAVCLLAFVHQGRQLPMAPVALALAANGFLLTVARLREESAHKKWVEDVFGRYVSPRVLEHLMRTPGAVEIGGRRQIITVLFSDIRGFTAQSEQMQPEQVTLFLNSYLGKMVDVIFANGGTIDKYLGDGIMAVWNWPVEQPDHALRAVRAAVQMQQQVENSASEWQQMGFPTLNIGIGIHTGAAVLGNIGSPRRMEQTAIGDTVNVASRLEALNKEIGKSLNCNILISQSTQEAMHEALGTENSDGFTLLPAGETAIRGRHDTMKIFAVLLNNS